MTRSKRTVELIKTALIVLLTANALVLGWYTGLFNDFFRSIPLFASVADLVRGAAGTSGMSSPDIKEAARPLSIVITTEEGERYGVKYDIDARNAAYERTSSILGEALGSAFAPLVITENEWRDALSGAGVLYEYFTPIKLSVLDKWLGVRMPETLEDASVRRIFVAFGEDRSRIFYQDIERDLFFGADTASAAGKLQELYAFGANGAVFAFQTGISASDNAPYMLILPERNHPVVHASAAGSAEELLEVALRALGHINESFTKYYDSNGSLVCVGTQFRIMVDTNGRVLYRRTDGLLAEEEGRVQSPSEMIERARIVITDTIGNIYGNAEVFYESFEDGEENTGSVVFGYYIAGGRIHLYEDSYAARITIKSGVILEAELFFRSFSFSGEYAGLLLERQALAAAGGEFLLCYSDTGQELPKPFWVRHT